VGLGLFIACIAALLGCTDNGGSANGGPAALEVDIDGDGVLDTLPVDTVDLRDEFTFPEEGV
jgi:hypothetical protein